MQKVPVRYLPKSLSRQDKAKQKKSLRKSRSAYKRKQYISRPKLKSFKSKKSKHISNAKRRYKVKEISVSRKLASKSKCSISALRKIFRKGEGAYYSSGSRPNQTAQSWGYARLASSLTGGKASSVDFEILKKGCRQDSPALKLAKRNYKKPRKTRKVKI